MSHEWNFVDFNKIHWHNNSILSSNFSLPWRGDICCLLGLVTALQVVCPAILQTLRKATSSWTMDVQHFPVGLHHPFSPLTESAFQLGHYILFIICFPKRKSEVLWNLCLKSVLKCFLVSSGFLPHPKSLFHPRVFISRQLWLFQGSRPMRSLWSPIILDFSPFVWRPGLFLSLCTCLVQCGQGRASGVTVTEQSEHSDHCIYRAQSQRSK